MACTVSDDNGKHFQVAVYSVAERQWRTVPDMNVRKTRFHDSRDDAWSNRGDLYSFSAAWYNNQIAVLGTTEEGAKQSRLAFFDMEAWAWEERMYTNENTFAPWRDFVVPGPTKKRACPAHDEPNDSDPPPTGKPSNGRAPAEYWIPWAELIRKTVGVDPEICVCGARMIVDDAITEGEKIAATLARLGIESTGPPQRRRSKGELDYVYDV